MKVHDRRCSAERVRRAVGSGGVVGLKRRVDIEAFVIGWGSCGRRVGEGRITLPNLYPLTPLLFCLDGARTVRYPEIADTLLGWDHHSGFSVDNTVSIPRWDRAGLERLVRYCARHPFAKGRLRLGSDDHVVSQLREPDVGGRTQIRLQACGLFRRQEPSCNTLQSLPPARVVHSVLPRVTNP